MLLTWGVAWGATIWICLNFFSVKKTNFFLGAIFCAPFWGVQPGTILQSVHFSFPFWGLKLLRNFKSFAAKVRVNSKHFPDEHAAQTASLRAIHQQPGQTFEDNASLVCLSDGTWPPGNGFIVDWTNSLPDGVTMCVCVLVVVECISTIFDGTSFKVHSSSESGTITLFSMCN